MKLASIFLLFISLTQLLWARDNVQFYIEKYGRVNLNTPQIERVYRIFNKVRAVADVKHYHLPQLAIIDSTGKPWAVALPDGYIILSKQVINLCYEQADEALGDARIAFILGHELAHLANDDFWHQEIAQFIDDDQALEDILAEYVQQGGKQKELAADDRGFIYAAMAGYAVDRLLTGEAGNSFFHQWQQRTAARVHQDTHPSAEQRAAMLQARLKDVLRKVDFFHFGVRLSYFGRCEDAIYFYRAFQKVFPSREVLNNLGFCHLRLAQKAMGNEAYLYWMPLTLEVVTQADYLMLPSFKTLRSFRPKQEVENFLRQAENFLRLATQADDQFIPAWINLAVVHLYLGNIYQARAAVEKARRLAPDNLEVQGLRAVVLYEEGLEADTWPQAITILQNLAKEADAPLSVVYNTAQLLEIRQRSAATPLWQRLTRQVHKLPRPIRKIVCQQQDCPPISAKNSSKTWSLPVSVGTYVKRDRQVQQILNEWQKIPFDWQKELYGVVYRQPDKGTTVLELAGYTEMVVLEPTDLQPTELEGYCGQPLQQTEILNYQVYTCQNWIALQQNGEVTEIWVTK